MQHVELAVLEPIRDRLSLRKFLLEAWLFGWFPTPTGFLWTIYHLAMAPRRLDRITRSGDPHKTPVSITVPRVLCVA
jgi:hypothetical protein